MGVLLSLFSASDCKTPKPYSAPDQSLYHFLTQLLRFCVIANPVSLLSFLLLVARPWTRTCSKGPGEALSAYRA
jgi:hypothetical protein